MEHYEIYLDLVTIAKGEIRRAVEQASVPSKSRPIYVKDEAEKRAYEQAWVSYIKEGLLPTIYEKFKTDLKAANDLLNTAAVHARVTGQCPSW